MISLSQAKASEVFYQPNRYYDSKTCQFISPDTVVPNPLKSQALNHYAYTYNNPLKYTDPSGHVPVGDGWIDRIINAFFGGGSKPPPSGYKGSIGGDSRASHMSERAIRSQGQHQATVKLAAGAAVAAREVEFKTGVSLIAGSADVFYYTDPSTYTDAAMYNNGKLQPPSEPLFAIVDLDLHQEPGYQIPYYTGAAVGAGFVVIPAAIALKYGFAPKSIPAPNPHPRPVRPQPGRRDPKKLRPGEVPAIAGGAPDIDFNNPRRYSAYPPGSLVHEYHHGDTSYVCILYPRETIGNKTTSRLSSSTYVSGNLDPDSSFNSIDSGNPKRILDGFILFVQLSIRKPGTTVNGFIQESGDFQKLDDNALLFRASHPKVIFPNDASNN